MGQLGLLCSSFRGIRIILSDKDELYLACVERCFQELTESLEKELLPWEETLTPERYFEARLAFFRQHPEHQKLFCDTLICQQEALKECIRAIRKPFDDLNGRLLRSVLQKKKLAEGITMDDVMLQLRLYEGFVSTWFRNTQTVESQAEQYDELCRKMLNIMLYGLLARE